jgi:hypothetical protein
MLLEHTKLHSTFMLPEHTKLHSTFMLPEHTKLHSTFMLLEHTKLAVYPLLQILVTTAQRGHVQLGKRTRGSLGTCPNLLTSLNAFIFFDSTS